MNEVSHMAPAHQEHLAHALPPGEPAHATFRGYVIGFLLSVVLTAIPFWLVMARPIQSQQATALIVIAFAFVQIIVHMIFFLHMDPRSESGWTLMALVFTLVLLTIALTGTLWVMYHLNVNMMPGMPGMG